MSAKNLLRETATNAEHLGECRNGRLARYICGPHFLNLGIAKFRSMMRIAVARIAGAGGIAAAFRGLVSHIVGMRAKKQMRRITARRIIATVKDLKTHGVFMGQFPNNPMRQKSLPAWATRSDSKFSVSRLREQASRPFPTFIPLSFVDSRPKRFQGLFGKLGNWLSVRYICHQM